MADNHLKIYKGTTYVPQATEPANPANGDIYYDSTLDRFRAYEAGTWVDLISRAAGGINYILNPDAESDTSGWATYDNGAVAAPVDGNGGAPSFISFVRTQVVGEVLRKTASFKISKSSGDGQGEGVSYDFSVDPIDRDSKLNVSFDFKNLDANYVNGDVKVYVYDVDNATLIGEVTNDDDGSLFTSNAEGSTFTGEFISTDSDNYRLIFHNTSSTTANWAISIDNVSVGPTLSTLFSVMNEWKSYVPTIGSTGTTPTVGTTSSNIVYYRRVGDTLELQFEFEKDSGGSPGTGFYFWNLPDGLEVDTDKFNFNGNFTRSTIGAASANIDGATGAGQMRMFSTTTFTAEIVLGSGGSHTLISFNFFGLGGTNVRYSMSGRVPIVGWKSSNLVSNNVLNQQTIEATGAGNTGQSITANSTDVPFTVTSNPFGNFDGTTFTAHKAGRYSITGAMIYTGSTSYRVDAYVNTVQIKSISDPAASDLKNFSGRITLAAGDELTIRASGSGTLLSSAILHHITIESIPDFTSYGVLNPKTEYVEAEVTSIVQTVTSNVYIDAPGAEITLQPGTWDIGYDGQLYVQNVSSGGVILSNGAIRDAANNVIPNTISLTTYDLGVTTGTNFGCGPVSARTQIIVTTPTTYKLSCRCAVSNTLDRAGFTSDSFTGTLTNPDTGSTIWARKVA